MITSDSGPGGPTFYEHTGIRAADSAWSIAGTIVVVTIILAVAEYAVIAALWWALSLTLVP